MAARNGGCGPGGRIFRCIAWRILAVAAGLGVPAETARAADDGGLHCSRAATRNELVAIVTKQLVAFRTGDAAGAYAFTARGLREKFSPEQFMAMVGHAYPAIAHNARAEFGLSSDDGARAMLPVCVFTADGGATSYRYLLVREEGAWRVSAVVRSNASPPGNEA
jgi:hypothetical protein